MASAQVLLLLRSEVEGSISICTIRCEDPARDETNLCHYWGVENTRHAAEVLRRPWSSSLAILFESPKPLRDVSVSISDHKAGPIGHSLLDQRSPLLGEALADARALCLRSESHAHDS